MMFVESSWYDVTIIYLYLKKEFTLHNRECTCSMRMFENNGAADKVMSYGIAILTVCHLIIVQVNRQTLDRHEI